MHQVELYRGQHGGNVEKVLLQPVNQGDGELAVHYILLCHNNQSVGDWKIIQNSTKYIIVGICS